MIFLKQSTIVTVKIGPAISSVDASLATGLTITQADVRLSKNGGNIAPKGDVTNSAHDELAIYDCVLSATDTGTLGCLQLYVAETDTLPIAHDFMVVTANVYDTLCSTDYLDVNLVADQSAATVGTVTGLSTAGVDAILDDACDSTITVRQALKIILAAVAGKTTVAGAVVNFRDVADTKNRIAATVATSTKTRTAVTLDGA